MSIKNTKAQTIKIINESLTPIDQIYQKGCVNWTGKTIDTKEYYSEIIANIILRDLKKFDDINTISRSNTYCRDNHSNININLAGSNRYEENFAKRITGLEIEKIGYIRDYQVPLKDTNADRGVGKIDLISFNNNTDVLYLIELKYKENKETLLRSMLEIYTYYKLVDQDKIIKDCFDNYKSIINKVFKSKNIQKIKVKPAVLSTPSSNAHAEMLELESGNRPKLKALSLALDINLFTLELYSDEIIL